MYGTVHVPVLVEPWYVLVLRYDSEFETDAFGPSSLGPNVYTARSFSQYRPPVGLSDFAHVPMCQHALVVEEHNITTTGRTLTSR